jgi:hypothetical protein
MLVFSNQRLGPAAELFVGDETASEILRSVADAARPIASAMWEHELVRWLDEQSTQQGKSTRTIDVGDIAFTPQHFERQRRFLIEAIERAREASDHSRVLSAWAVLIEGYPSDSVQFGRRWIWHSSV